MGVEWDGLVVEPGFHHYRVVGAPTLNVCNPDEMLSVNFTDHIIPVDLPFAFAIHFMFRERDVVVRYGDANSKSDLAQIFISGPLQRKTRQYRENRRLRTYRHETKRQDKRTHCKSPMYNASWPILAALWASIPFACPPELPFVLTS